MVNHLRFLRPPTSFGLYVGLTISLAATDRLLPGLIGEDGVASLLPVPASDPLYEKVILPSAAVEV